MRVVLCSSFDQREGDMYNFYFARRNGAFALILAGVLTTIVGGFSVALAQQERPLVRDIPKQLAKADFVPGEIIVKFKPGMAPMGLAATALQPVGLRASPRVTSGCKAADRIPSPINVRVVRVID